MSFFCMRSTLTALLLLTTQVGCATYTEEMAGVRSAYRGRSYGDALTRLETSDVKEQDRNKLLYTLDKAMIQDRLGKHGDAQKLFKDADAIVDDLYTESISKTVASFVVNDSTTDYAGEDFEKVALHTMWALSLLQAGDLKSARVEAKRINTRLQEINDGYDKDSKNRYSEDAFARMLAGMIFEALGEYDDAIIDYRKALTAYEGIYKTAFSTPPPLPLLQSLHRLLTLRKRSAELAELNKSYGSQLGKMEAPPKQNGELVVIHESGTIAIKETMEFLFPYGSQVVRFSFPIVKFQPRNWGSTGVSVGDVKCEGMTVENLDAIAHETMNDKRARVIIKQGVRLVAKGQLVDQAHRNFGILGGLTANLFTAATEVADTRSWTTLPSQILVTRCSLPAGEHTLNVKTAGSSHVVEKVLIRSGEMTFLRTY
jgi:hypothetical protein